MEAFVYSWVNRETGRQYIGYHKGSDDDGYEFFEIRFILEGLSKRKTEKEDTIPRHSRRMCRERIGTDSF